VLRVRQCEHRARDILGKKERPYGHARNFRLAQLRQFGKKLVNDYRLFYVGISLFLRNIWVFLHALFFADGTDTQPEPRLEKLRFADMLEWLADFIKSVLEVAPGFRIDCNTGKRFTAEGTA
jgi:hypothetical protein